MPGLAQSPGEQAADLAAPARQKVVEGCIHQIGDCGNRQQSDAMEPFACKIFQPILHLLTNVRSPGALELPWQWFSTIWSGQPFSSQAGFRLCSDGQFLRFEAQTTIPAREPMPGETRGAFLENLWTRDVAELFVAGEGSTYTEWNLSPHGAWWAQGFNGQRVRIDDFTRPGPIETWAEPTEAGGWRAGLIFPLAPELRLEELRLNITMIFGTGESRNYLATVTLPDAAPDFHIINCYPKPILEKN